MIEKILIVEDEMWYVDAAKSMCQSKNPNIQVDHVEMDTSDLTQSPGLSDLISKIRATDYDVYIVDSLGGEKGYWQDVANCIIALYPDANIYLNTMEPSKVQEEASKMNLKVISKSNMMPKLKNLDL